MINLYQTCYDLVATYIYGGTVEAGSHMDLVCTMVSTCANLFLVALPFLLVWKVIRML